jgi:hypothetical protein
MHGQNWGDRHRSAPSRNDHHRNDLNQAAQNGAVRHHRDGRHQNGAPDAPDPDLQNARSDRRAPADDRRRGDHRAPGDRSLRHHAPGATHHGVRTDDANHRVHRGELDDPGAIPQPPSPGLGPYGDQNGGSYFSGQRGYRVGVLEVCQQLGKAAGVLKKEPANHCLKPRRPAINAGLSFAGSTAGTIAALPYQL